jgi:hypothetical protein
MTTVLTLEPPCALISANQRLHYAPKAKLTAAWRGLAARTVNTGFYPDRYKCAHITVAIRFPTNHRRDVGNYYPTAKAIVDGLVYAQLLADDDDTRVIGPDLRRDRPNGPLRVTVTVEAIK